jgi:hypothetical protein
VDKGDAEGEGADLCEEPVRQKSFRRKGVCSSSGEGDREGVDIVWPRVRSLECDW